MNQITHKFAYIHTLSHTHTLAHARTHLHTHTRTHTTRVAAGMQWYSGLYTHTHINTAQNPTYQKITCIQKKLRHTSALCLRTQLNTTTQTHTYTYTLSRLLTRARTHTHTHMICVAIDMQRYCALYIHTDIDNPQKIFSYKKTLAYTTSTDTHAQCVCSLSLAHTRARAYTRTRTRTHTTRGASDMQWYSELYTQTDTYDNKKTLWYQKITLPYKNTCTHKRMTQCLHTHMNASTQTNIYTLSLTHITCTRPLTQTHTHTTARAHSRTECL